MRERGRGDELGTRDGWKGFRQPEDAIRVLMWYSQNTYRKVDVPKEAVFTLKLESDLRDAFAVEAAATHRTASDLVRAFMRDFVGRQREARKQARLRAKSRPPLNDFTPAVPDDLLRNETRVHIDLSAEERAAAFEIWSASHRSTEPLSDYAVSREGIYEGREG
jgi:hypothetical protein